MSNRPGSPTRTQHGAALLLALLVALTLSLSWFFKAATPLSAKLAGEQRTARALAQAKAALIAWSVVQGDMDAGIFDRPGSLPCPDRENSGIAPGSCTSAGAGTSIGRLPWKTLGIEDLRDADGERLWYALSNSFRVTHSAAINSDTRGQLQLYAADGTTLLTPAGEELAAIIFSAGPPLAGQDRAAAPLLAANYLDAASPWNNAKAPGPFISGPLGNAQGEIVINDRAMALSTRELIGAVEQRALKEAQSALAAFALAHGAKYPNPAKSNDATCLSPISNIKSNNTCASAGSDACFGRFPEDSPGAALAPWFLRNGWGRVMVYAVNKNSVVDPGAAECSTALNVDGASADYLLLAPGSARQGQSRPSPSLASYLDDGANNDAWTSGSIGQAIFAKPSTASNDTLRSRP